MATVRLNCFIHRLTRGMAAERLADQSDRQLIERLLVGPDEPAFEALVRRHGPMVYRVCWRVLQHADDSEDAFQATFLLLARKLSTVKKDSLASWLHGVAHRVSLDARKQAAKRRRHEAHVPASHDGPPDEITWRELRAVLDAELTSLPEKLRLPLILCYLEGRSQEDAAKHLACSKSTLLRRLEEARAALGRRLTRKGVIWPAAVAGVLISDCVAPAALSSKLIGSSVEAAACALVGRAAAGLVSTKVTALAEGVVKAMFMSKIKSVIAAVLLGAVLVSGGLALTGRPALLLLAAAQSPQDSRKSSANLLPPETPAARDGDKPKTQRKPVVVREDAQVLHVAWSGDSKIVATVGIAYEVVEGISDNVPVKSLMPHSTVKFWDAKTGKLLKSLGEEKKTYITALALSQDKKHAAIAGFRHVGNGEEFVRILDAETWAVKQELDDVPRVDALAFSPDGKTLAMGGTSSIAESGAFVKFWDVQGEKMKGGTAFAAEVPENEPDGRGEGLAFSPDSKVLAAGEYSKGSKVAKIQLYDAQTGKPKQELDLGKDDRGWIRAAFTADGSKLVSVSGGRAKIWDVRTGKSLRTLDTKGLVFGVAVSPAGGYLATAGHRKETDKGKEKWFSEILLWDAKTGEPRGALPEQDASRLFLRSIIFSPDGRSLAVGATTDAEVKDGGKVSGELRVFPVSG